MSENKKSITVNMEPEQLNLLSEIMTHTGIDNQQIHIRLALRQYISKEHDKISGIELQKIRASIISRRTENSFQA